MSTAEFLPDKINMMNEDGDVVAIDAEPQGDFLDSPDIDDAVESEGDRLETYRSPNYFIVDDIIRAGIEKSRADGYASLKVFTGARAKPLGQFLAVDLYKYGLSMEEVRELIDRYKDADATPRSIGRTALNGSLRGDAAPDVRMLAANDDTYRD